VLWAGAASAGTIVLVGDSISAGVGASSPRQAYAWRLERSLSTRHRVVNYSRPGWSVRGDVGVFNPTNFAGAAALWPDVVVLALGHERLLPRRAARRVQRRIRDGAPNPRGRRDGPLRDAVSATRFLRGHAQHRRSNDAGHDRIRKWMEEKLTELLD
jgi:hypothetical protein